MTTFEKTYYENDTFWKEGGIGTPGKKRILRTIELLPEGISNLIDVGCGNGIFCNQLHKSRPELNVLGMDRSVAALKFVQTEKVEGNINNIPFPDNSYDCVTCLQVLEHLPVNIYDQSISELARISAQYLVISVPFEEDLALNVTQCPNCKSVFNWDLHLRSFNKSSMENLFQEHGFECIHHETLFKEKRPLGWDQYVKFRKKRNPKFKSPICPVCGYSNPHYNQPEAATNGKPHKSSARDLIKKMVVGIINPIWPKVENPGYWIIGVYQKK